MTVTTKQLKNLKGSLSDERRALLGSLVSDGWSFNQIYLTHRIHRKTVKKYYPDYQGVSKQDGARLGAAFLHAFHNMNHT